MSNSGGSSPFLDTPIDHDSLQEVKELDEGLSMENDPGLVTSVKNSDENDNNNNDASDTITKPESITEKDRRILSLEYQLSTLRNEYDLERLQLQRNASETERKYKATVEELESTLNDTKFLHDSNTKLLEEVASLKEQLDKCKSENREFVNKLNEELRSKTRLIEDMELDQRAQLSHLEQEVKNLNDEKRSLGELLQKYKDEIIRQSNEIRNLTRLNSEKEEELLKLKGSQIAESHPNYSTEEFQELSTMNKLFQEQNKYIKELEEANFKQAKELKKFRNMDESISFWKSENEKLQNKLKGVDMLEQQLQDSQLEIVELKTMSAKYEALSQALGDQQQVDGEGDKSGGVPSPEDIISDWQMTKKENLVLIDENSKLQLDVNNYKLKNEELTTEKNQLLELNKTYMSNIANLQKLNQELEQQKNLSLRESALLKRQLGEHRKIPMGKAEEEEERGGKDEGVKRSSANSDSREEELERLVEGYKNRTEELTNELKNLNNQLVSESENQQDQLLKRRKLDNLDINETYSERLNELQLQNTNLQRDLQKFRNLNKLLEDKLYKVLNLEGTKIRILQQRDSPFLKDQLIKKKELDLLRKANADLLEKQLNADLSIQSVPISVYNSMNFDLQRQEEEIFKVNKRLLRLKEVFNKKSLEFIDVVNSILGFKLEFRPDAKVKIYSCFKPDKFLLVDLAKNTLESNLKLDNWDELLGLWIEGRGQIPCFLATITLQLWQASTGNEISK